MPCMELLVQFSYMHTYAGCFISSVSPANYKRSNSSDMYGGLPAQNLKELIYAMLKKNFLKKLYLVNYE